MPYLFPKKEKWKLDSVDAAESYEQAVNSNYPSAEKFKDALGKELEEQVAEKMMIRTTIGLAVQKYGKDGVKVAAMAVIQEADDIASFMTALTWLSLTTRSRPLTWSST